MKRTESVWSCGAFGNKPDEVSEYFRKVIADEGYGKLFEHICFAIYSKEDGRNYLCFKKTFSELIFTGAQNAPVKF